MGTIAANRWLIGTATAALIGAATLWEGVRYVPYVDLAGIPTVCMGYTGKGIVKGRRYSPEECNGFLRKELNIHSQGVLSCITKPLTVNEYNAFTLMAYNVGVSGFCSSETVKQFNLGNNKLACARMATNSRGQPAWSYVKRKFVPGLHKRRLYEREMCLGGIHALPE